MPEQADLTRPGQGEFDAVADYYDHLMRTVPYRGWVDYVEQILSRWRARPKVVLDLACGTGKIGSEMLRRGYDAMGADLSEPMVRRCADQEPPLTAVVCDASALTLADNAFDLIVCLYDSLNYILEADDLKQAFAHVRAALKPSGVFVFDVNTVHALEAELFTQASGPSAPLRYRWRSKYDRHKRQTRVEMSFEILATGEKIEIVHRQRAYTDVEIRSLLHRGGFTGIQCYEAYRMTPPTPTSDRVFYVAVPR